MPNANRVQTVYLITGNPDTHVDNTPYVPGQLGEAFDYNDRAYQVVNVDSGATAATAAGLPAANELAFWKDRSVYLVTNDRNQCDLGPTNYFNSIAGIFRKTLVAADVATNGANSPNLYGAQICILQRGRSISVKSDGGGAKGDYAVGKQGVDLAEVTNVSAGTAPVSQTVGVITAAAAGGNITVDVDIPNIP